jgi:hypothetical protein
MRIFFRQSYVRDLGDGATESYRGGFFYLVEDEALAQQLLADGLAVSEAEAERELAGSAARPAPGEDGFVSEDAVMFPPQNKQH